MVSAFILTLVGNKIVLKAKFITIVALEYKYSYTAKLYSTLGTFVVMKEYTSLHLRNQCFISISTDYQAVIDTLYQLNIPIHFNAHLH